MWLLNLTTAFVLLAVVVNMRLYENTPPFRLKPMSVAAFVLIQTVYLANLYFGVYGALVHSFHFFMGV